MVTADLIAKVEIITHFNYRTLIVEQANYASFDQEAREFSLLFYPSRPIMPTFSSYFLSAFEKL